MPLPLTTAGVKPILGIPAGVTFHDSAIGLAVDYANDRLLRALGQSALVATTVQEYPEVYDAGQADVLLGHAPVVSIVAATNYDTAVAATDYRLDTETGKLTLLREAGYWSTAREGAMVLYTYGYTSATAPTELLRAAELMCAASFNRGKHAGLKQHAASGYSYTLSDDEMPPEARAILARYEDVHHS